MIEPKYILKLTLYLAAACVVMLIIVPLVGSEIKGAKRWISFGGFSLQPSEFMKPAFAIISAWLFAQSTTAEDEQKLLYKKLAIGSFLALIALLLLQPDFGMVMLITAIWFGQFFLAGLPYLWISIGGLAGLMGMVGAYFMFPHVSKRIDRFLAPEQMDKFSEGYQISQSIEAITSGGFFGVGPGEGVVKTNLPDSHADFIFAVIAEEYGMIMCTIIVGLFCFIMARSFWHAMRQDRLFLMLAIVGISAQVTAQAFINIASTIHLIPTKGMTLPLISYGGSSILASCFALGALLSFTRKRVKFGREGL